MNYDELSKLVNDTYRETGDIRETMVRTGLTFDEVWDDDRDEGLVRMEGLIGIFLLGLIIYLIIRSPTRNHSPWHSNW